LLFYPNQNLKSGYFRNLFALKYLKAGINSRQFKGFSKSHSRHQRPSTGMRLKPMLKRRFTEIIKVAADFEEPGRKRQVLQQSKACAKMHFNQEKETESRPK